MFEANIQNEVDNVYNNLTEVQREDLLKHFIKKEAIKKQKEINVNYKDLSKFDPNRFSSLLEDRLINKLPTTSEKELSTV